MPEIVDGYLILLDQPGWGIDLNEETVRKHPSFTVFLKMER